MPDQRALLRARLAGAIDAVTDAASNLEPQVTRVRMPPPPPAPPAAPERPWSLAAAMEPIPQPAAERPGPPRGLPPAAGPPPPPGLHRIGIPTAVIGSGVLVLIVILAVVLRIATGGGSAPVRATDPVALTAVRPVAAAAPSTGGMLPTQVSFPARTTTVYIDVASGDAADHGPVEILVNVGQPAQAVIDHSYVLNSMGDTVIPLSPPGGWYAPGDYTVTITAGGTRLGATEFEVR